MEAPTVRAPFATASPAFGTLPCGKSGKFHIFIGGKLAAHALTFDFETFHVE
jgi:hypothetical protein